MHQQQSIIAGSGTAHVSRGKLRDELHGLPQNQLGRRTKRGSRYDSTNSTA